MRSRAARRASPDAYGEALRHPHEPAALMLDEGLGEMSVSDSFLGRCFCVLLALLARPASAEALLCIWFEQFGTFEARGLGEDGRVRKLNSAVWIPQPEAVSRLEATEPVGEPVTSELMILLHDLVRAVSKGPFRDDPGVRGIRAGNIDVICFVPGPGSLPRKSVVLRQCHNRAHINTAPDAPKLMSYLTNLIRPSFVELGDQNPILNALRQPSFCQ